MKILKTTTNVDTIMSLNVRTASQYKEIIGKELLVKAAMIYEDADSDGDIIEVSVIFTEDCAYSGISVSIKESVSQLIDVLDSNHNQNDYRALKCEIVNKKTNAGRDFFVINFKGWSD